MPIQAPPWTDFLSCPICCNEFAINQRVPISLGCGHTICRLCLTTLQNRQCPFDQTTIVTDVDSLPFNYALLQLVSNGSGGGGKVRGNDNVDEANCDIELAGIDQNTPLSVRNLSSEDLKSYVIGKKCIEDLALHLKCFLNNGNLLTRPMQRKLVTLVNCQLMEEEGRVRALRAARSLGDRTVTELILQHQNPQQLSSNLWAAVRSRGCQFLGPAMQELVLKLVLLALEDGSALSRKVLVMFVVQRLETKFPQASKTSIGHVVQLLYRASCFKVSKREADSSLMQLKEEFRTYDALRREHDAQIVQIATEAGLRIAPDQWSSLLYGDIAHKSHMQSIIDKLQTPSSFAQSVQELVIALQRTNDPANLANLHDHFKYLASIDPCVETASWSEVGKALDSVRQAVVGLVQFLQHHGNRKSQDCTGVGQLSSNTKYKISLCRDLTVRRMCPRGSSCTFAHSEEELERYRAKNRGKQLKHTTCCVLKPIQIGNPKKHLHTSEDDGNSPNKSLLPVSPMRFVGPQPPNTVSRSYMDPSCGLQPHQVSPGAARPQPHVYPTHHSPVSPQHMPLNGAMLGTHFDARYNNNNNNNNNNNMNFIQTMQSPLRSRDFMSLPPPPLQQPLVHQRNMTTANPPSFKANNNNNNNNSNPSHNLSNIPDIYMNSNVFFGKGATNNNLNSNDIDPTTHSAGNQLWEPGFQQLPPHSSLSSSKIHQMNILGPTTSQNPNRTSSTISKIPNTSFFVKKPPNSKDLNKGISEMSLGVSPHFWKIALHANNSKVDQMEMVKNAYRDRDSFVRSDSILDDDATTFDVPPSLSMQSQFGPICPKYKGSANSSTTGNSLLDSWGNNDLNDKQEFIPDEHALLAGDQNFPVFLHANDNHMALNIQSLQGNPKLTQSAHPELNKFQKLSEIDLSVIMPGKRTQIPTNNINNNINKANTNCDATAVLWDNGLKPQVQNLSHLNQCNNYWSSAESNATTGQFKSHQLGTARKAHLTTEDSFDGGIDSGMMRDLEQKLVEIVDKVSTADDSGIKMD